MRATGGRHGVEYAIEGAGLGLFMFVAEAAGVLISRTSLSGVASRLVFGLAMGLTVIALVYSPPGRRSGAHLNPALSLTFWRLGKLSNADLAGYVGAQFAGGLAGVALAALCFGRRVAAPEVDYLPTVPGVAGVAGAFAGEFAISLLLVTAVLQLSNRPRFAPVTGLACGVLVLLYITFESPLSGMSMNPARTLASAVPSARYEALWLYAVAPILGMLTAAELFIRTHGRARVLCAKLFHPARGLAPARELGPEACHFNCTFPPETT